ncbi:MAG: hypothetical protein ONB31_06470 [candidate division KSB1 bacterium]|nr:hypothetical protein [candidate division KSB1 bacterium]MDZ7356776.1 hypothetical protein [candidate division KSB1 bacterium]MDZ7401265.1 hypothetical protein [candidate division KSB1 bacterium]
MKRFQEEKKFYVIILLSVGVLGLVFPLIPGLLLIGLAVALMAPKSAEVLQQRIKRIIEAVASNLR